MFYAGAKPIIKSSSWASDVRAIGFRQWEDDGLRAPDPHGYRMLVSLSFNSITCYMRL